MLEDYSASDEDTAFGDYTAFDVAVDGGTIRVGRWGSGERLVVASHGITANHLSWLAVARAIGDLEADDVSLVAVDHRGRAGSADTPGPFGLEAHADDLVAVLDHVGGSQAVFLGHSMGGFVVALAAERHPDRVARLVLVDGGLPLPLELAPNADVEEVVGAVIGPALERLDQRWTDEDSYVAFFEAHPAFQPPNPWPSAAEAYVRYDATTMADGQIGSSVNKQAVLVDGGEAITNPEAAAAIERISTPSLLLWAPRGLLDQTPGLYPAEQVEAADAALTHLSTSLVEDTNHYTVAVSDLGAAAVARAIVG